MRYKRNDDSEKMVLLFRRNDFNKEKYDFNFCFLGNKQKDDTIRSNYCSKFRKHEVSGNDIGWIFNTILDVDDEKLFEAAEKGNSKKKLSAGFKDKKVNTDCEYICIVIDDKIESKIYESIKDKEKMDNLDIIKYYLEWATKLGTAIGSIDLDKKTFTFNVRKKVSEVPENEYKISLDSLLSHEEQEKLQQRIEEEKRKNQLQQQKEHQNVEDPKIIQNPSIPPQKEAMLVGEEFNKTKIVKDENVGNISNYKDIDVDRIKSEIKKVAILQDQAVDKVINNIYLNQVIIESGNDNLLRSKSNILFDGPTGTGKTLILEETVKRLGLPMVLTSINNYSTAGYKGADLTSVLVNLLNKAGGDLELAERGVVVFDEIDKLANNKNKLGMKEGLQQELLTYLSGSKVEIQYNNTPIIFDTSKITFVGLGAFTDLRERKIKEQEQENNSLRKIGFSNTEENQKEERKEEQKEKTYTIEKEDYIQYGLQRELVGRFPCVAFTNELGIKDLEQILTESEISPLKQLKELCQFMGCDFEIETSAIYDIAKIAFDKKTGARSLHDVIKDIQESFANDLISRKIDKIVIDDAAVERAGRVQERVYYSRSK